MGFTRAKELVFSGRSVDAEEALQLGLIHRIVPDDEVLDGRSEQAREYARDRRWRWRWPSRCSPRAWRRACSSSSRSKLLVQPALMQTSDHAEGTASFREKRQPRFIGR
jgi:2-(1,2-epoxy-1,2-dihydrophenyl)acetyl-CoA isomerase